MTENSARRKTTRSGGRSRRGVLRELAVTTGGLAVIGLVAGLISAGTVAAQFRAVAVLGSFLEMPVVTPTVTAVTGEPRLVEEDIAGSPAVIAYPAGDGPHPALLFANGAVPEGREHPAARRLALSFARAGFLVVLPDLPGLRELELRPETVAEGVEVATAITERPDVRDGRLALLGVSTGGSLAILIAEQPQIAPKVSVVTGIAPYADIRTVMALASTVHYARDGRFHSYPVDPYLPYVAGRSLVATVSDPGDRRALRVGLRRVDLADQDPYARLRTMSDAGLGPEARSVRALLVNRDPNRFNQLYVALPARIQRHLEALSPVAGAERLEAPVKLVTGPRDKYFPASESYNLKQVAPARRITITDVLDHAEIHLTWGNIVGLGQLNAFVVRSLREAAA